LEELARKHGWTSEDAAVISEDERNEEICRQNGFASEIENPYNSEEEEMEERARRHGCTSDDESCQPVRETSVSASDDEWERLFQQVNAG